MPTSAYMRYRAAATGENRRANYPRTAPIGTLRGAAASGPFMVPDDPPVRCPRGPMPYVGRVSAGTARLDGRSDDGSVPVVYVRSGGRGPRGAADARGDEGVHGAG